MNIVSPPTIEQVQNFLNLAGTTLSTFRYFSKRPVCIINKHLFTCLVFEKLLPVAYGHLDPEGENVWLGIAVAEAYRGKGIGKTVMEKLINKCFDLGVKEVFLSVDKDNIPAISLYRKFNFICYSESERVLLFRWAAK